MKKIDRTIDRNHHNMQTAVLALTLFLFYLGLNYQHLYSAWAIWSETKRLVDLAKKVPEDFQNPAPVENRFEGKLSPDFWEFTAINGGGEVSNEMAWPSAAIILDKGLTFQHLPDHSFKNEKPDQHEPASDQYNNVTLIGGRGFRPSPSRDVVLQFSSRASEPFYGTAGVIFQPSGTLKEDGLFAKLFDMFGFAIVGEESSFQGMNGSICYLALNWMPVRVEPLHVDPNIWQNYELRLRWISKTEWLEL